MARRVGTRRSNPEPCRNHFALRGGQRTRVFPTPTHLGHGYSVVAPRTAPRCARALTGACHQSQWAPHHLWSMVRRWLLPRRAALRVTLATNLLAEAAAALLAKGARAEMGMVAPARLPDRWVTRRLEKVVAMGVAGVGLRPRPRSTVHSPRCATEFRVLEPARRATVEARRPTRCGHVR